MEAFVLKIESGKAVLINARTGGQVRPMVYSVSGAKALGGQVQGDITTVNYSDGKTVIFNTRTGLPIRTC